MIINLVLMLILHLVTPYWWWVLVIPFLFGFVRSRTGLRAFLVGMISAGMLWLAGAIYYQSNGGELITARVEQMVETASPYLLTAATTLIGMLCGGFSCASGFFLKAALHEEEKDQPPAPVGQSS